MTTSLIVISASSNFQVNGNLQKDQITITFRLYFSGYTSRHYMLHARGRFFEGFNVIKSFIYSCEGRWQAEFTPERHW